MGDNARVTPRVFQVPMGGGDCLTSGDPYICLPANTIKTEKLNPTTSDAYSTLLHNIVLVIGPSISFTFIIPNHDVKATVYSTLKLIHQPFNGVQISTT